jgi:hypothetical protein
VGGAVLTAVAREPARLRCAPNDLVGAVGRSAAWHRYRPGRPYPMDPAAAQREKRPFCDLIRDLFGNPFRPVAIDPAWLTPAVVAIARAAYEQRHPGRGTLDSARLAVLADALEEAGCTDPALLGHCRSGGEHYRGCFLVDALLGKG